MGRFKGFCYWLSRHSWQLLCCCAGIAGYCCCAGVAGYCCCAGVVGSCRIHCLVRVSCLHLHTDATVSLQKPAQGQCLCSVGTAGLTRCRPRATGRPAQPVLSNSRHTARIMPPARMRVAAPMLIMSYQKSGLQPGSWFEQRLRDTLCLGALLLLQDKKASRKQVGAFDKISSDN